MAISEERREVAERLRQMTEKHSAVEASRVAHAMGLEYEVHGTVVAFDSADVRALANLIEPQERTCHDVSDDESVFQCSRCGCAISLCTAEVDVFENATYGPTLTMPNGRGGELSFCPNCGAEVVDDGD